MVSCSPIIIFYLFFSPLFRKCLQYVCIHALLFSERFPFRLRPPQQRLPSPVSPASHQCTLSIFPAAVAYFYCFSCVLFPHIIHPPPSSRPAPTPPRPAPLGCINKLTTVEPSAERDVTSVTPKQMMIRTSKRASDCPSQQQGFYISGLRS